MNNKVGNVRKNERFRAKSRKTDFFLWLLIGFLLTAALGVDIRFRGSIGAWRLLLWMMLLPVSGLVFHQTVPGQRLWLFIREARIELRQVVWPTRQETIRATLMVSIVVMIAALFLWSIDSILLRLVAFFTG